MTESTGSGQAQRKSIVGVVVSNKMDKTAVVSVERREPHPLYRKIVRTTKRYKAHDPQNAAHLGDIVRIVETRPLSKEKRWRIAETLVRGDVAEIAPREIGVPEELLAPIEPQEPAAEQPVTAAAPAARPPRRRAAAKVEEAAEAEEKPAADEPPAEEAQA
jgi:small subunit ribosomal protein S17